MPLGRPVVPDENSTHSGASKSTRSKRSSAGVAVAVSQLTSPGAGSDSAAAGRPTLLMRTVARSVGSARCSAATSARRSSTRPFHR